MVKIYSHPVEITVSPESDQEYFVSAVKDYCKNNSKCPHAGEIVSFIIGDDFSVYMILDYRSLIYLPINDDCYQISDTYARGLRKADLIAMTSNNTLKEKPVPKGNPPLKGNYTFPKE